jgi:hypothetical protein
MKYIIIWIVAIVIRIAAAMFQRITGPTYPRKTKVLIDGKEIVLKLKRSQTNTHICKIAIEVPASVAGKLYYRRFPVNEEWNLVNMSYNDNKLSGELPSQPAAGKLQYYLMLTSASGQEIAVAKETPVVIRFKGNVPALVMIPHILIIFFAMLFSNLAGLLAGFHNPQQRKYGLWAFWLLTFGGMVLGPLVQKYAFGELWTGVPFGWDLTDNKMLIAFIFWLVAILMNRKKESYVYTIIASLVVLIIFSVPHSLFGSELNYATGVVSQG